MAANDFAGANNPVDAEGTGTLDATGPLPAMPATPEPTPVDLTQDPRYQAVIARLQPPPQPAGWQGALQKILPVLGAAVAMHQNAGGAFAQAWQGLQQQKQIEQDRQVENDLRLATILHQQTQEQATIRNQQLAQRRQDALAAKEAGAKRDKLMRDEWTAQSQGGLVDTINELIDKKGPDAADQYMANTNIGSLTEAGVPHTVKDLVDRYAVKGPDGHYIGGKTKTPKEVAAGSKEEYVLRARDLAAKALHPNIPNPTLTDEEQQKVDEKALTRYAGLTKDTDTATILKGLQIDTANLRNELLQQQLDRNLSEQYGSTPYWMQDGAGNPHVYFVKKGEHGEPPSFFELKNPGLPPDVSRLQPPSAFQKLLRSLGWRGESTPPINVIGGGTDPTDPNWGK